MTQREDRPGAPPLRERLEAGWSTFRERNRRLDRTVGRAVEGSRLYRSVAGFVPVIHDSRIVQWFTTAPEPTVVTVDLDRTWTVGPLLRVIDALVRPLREVIRGSVIRRAFVHGVAAVERTPIRASSAFALGLLATVVASTSGPTGLLAITATVLLGIVLMLGLLVNPESGALEESVAGDIASRVAGLIAPPKTESR